MGEKIIAETPDVELDGATLPLARAGQLVPDVASLIRATLDLLIRSTLVPVMIG
jgi:hypothetical protein